MPKCALWISRYNGICVPVILYLFRYNDCVSSDVVVIYCIYTIIVIVVYITACYHYCAIRYDIECQGVASFIDRLKVVGIHCACCYQHSA